MSNIIKLIIISLFYVGQSSLGFAHTLALTHVGGSPARAEVVVTASEDKVVTAGAGRLNGNAFGAVVRYLPNGSLDSSFGTKGIWRTPFFGKEYLYGLAVDGEGGVYAAGYLERWSRKDILIVKLTPKGVPDPKFGEGGFVVEDLGGEEEIHYMVRDSHGRLVLAGFTEAKEGFTPWVRRYLPDGKKDPFFAGQPNLKRGLFYSVSVDSRDRAVAVGATGDENGEGHCLVARFDEGGGLDTSFAQGGVWVDEGALSVCSTLTLGQDGTVFAAGYKKLGLNNTAFFMANLTPQGKENPHFGVGGRVTTDLGPGTDLAHGLAIRPEGSLEVAGEMEKGRTETSKRIFEMVLVRYDLQGRKDPHVYDRGVFKLPLSSREGAGFMGLALDPEGRLVLTGHAKKRFLLLRNP